MTGIRYITDDKGRKTAAGIGHHGLFQRPGAGGFQVAVAEFGELFAVFRQHARRMAQPVVASAGETVVA